MSRRLAALLPWTLALALPACAGRGAPCAPLPDPAELTPTETLLVMEGEGGEPMRLVLNSIPAGDAFLRLKSKPVDPADPVIAHLVERMLATVQAEGGVGIAAPQVGLSRRAVIVKRLDVEPEKPYRVYLNPRITSMSATTVVDWEGCLSIPAGFGKVSRADTIDIVFDTPDGKTAAETVAGFTARIFQHEIDHLEGILFIDRKEAGPLVPEDEYRKMKEKEKQKEQPEEAPPAGQTALRMGSPCADTTMLRPLFLAA